MEIEIFDVFNIRKAIIRLNRFCLCCNKKINYRSNVCNDCRLKMRWDRPTPKMIEQIRKAGDIAHSKPRSEKQYEHFKKIEAKGRNIAHVNLSDRMIGKVGYWKDKYFTDEHKQKIANSHKGKKAYQWKGGISFEPYCILFNKEFKERVREFFGQQCFECNKIENQNGRKLDVHHVNYDKMVCCNDVIPLFVALCRSCNIKANTNRKYWEEHFTQKIVKEFDGKCFYSKEEMYGKK